MNLREQMNNIALCRLKDWAEMARLRKENTRLRRGQRQLRAALKKATAQQPQTEADWQTMVKTVWAEIEAENDD